MSVQIDRDQCTGCGSCIPACPLHLLALTDDTAHNARGVRYICLSDASRCVECGRCTLLCSSAALYVPRRAGGYALLDKQHIPPHSGCYLGSLARALADAVHELGAERDVVLFKKKAADVSLHVESHDYDGEGFFDDGLAYKKAHPEKLVVLICSSSKAPSTARNEARFRALRDENVTIINTLNWFESDPDIRLLTAGGSHIAEELAAGSHASFVARSSVRSVQEITLLKEYIRQGLCNQRDGKSFSFIEMTFPCFYRLSGRPQARMPYEKLCIVNRWFDANVKPLYPEGVMKTLPEAEAAPV